MGYCSKLSSFWCSMKPTFDFHPKVLNLGELRSSELIQFVIPTGFCRWDVFRYSKFKVLQIADACLILFPCFKMKDSLMNSLQEEVT